MALTTRITSSLTADVSPATNTWLGAPTWPVSSVFPLTMNSGTATGLADRIWTASGRSIAPSATDSLDLQGTALLDPSGTAVVFVKLKLIRVVAAATNVTDVQVTRPATNGVPWLTAVSSAIPVQPGGMMEWVAPGSGIAVTAGTGDLLNLVNSGATAAVYDIVLIGTSA